MRTLLILTATAAALSACAADTAGQNRYATDTERLARDCEARGGILAPTGAVTGRPQTENVCKITGGPSGRIPPSS